MVHNRLSATLRSTFVALIFSAAAALPAGAQDVPVNTAAPKASASDLYIVQMIDAPVVAYTGGLPGLPATAQPRGQKLNPTNGNVVRYAAYLDSRHNDVLSKAGGRKVYDYRYAFNGFSAVLTREQVAAVRATPGVLAVEKTQEVVMETATTPAFLGLKDPVDGLWTKGFKGEDVIIGIVDSGIWPESKSFTDRTGVGPKGQPGKLDYHQIPGWHGKCASGEGLDGSFNASSCNQKLIGAQYFCAARGCENVLPHEFLSPRDFNGHGTHTASTAGGNEGVPITGAASALRSVSGIAPRARIAVYKVCWDNGAGGCGANSGDAVAAIDQAVIDGVDVINYSISGTSTNYLDSVEVAYLFAARAGVFVAAAAGNSGPTASTVAHISPWLASVAAGTHSRSGTATVTLGNGAVYTGASLTPGVGPAPIVLAKASGVAGADPDFVRQCFSADGHRPSGARSREGCGKDRRLRTRMVPPPAANARVDKSLAVKNAGGVGMVLYNVTREHHQCRPALAADGPCGQRRGSRDRVVRELGGRGATAKLSQASVTNSVAGSRRRCVLVTRPKPGRARRHPQAGLHGAGVDILAAVAPPGNAGKDFDLYSGTSMSSPHVAGIAALLTQAHPDWSPAAKRSAIATTADPRCSPRRAERCHSIRHRIRARDVRIWRRTRGSCTTPSTPTISRS